VFDNPNTADHRAGETVHSNNSLTLEEQFSSIDSNAYGIAYRDSIRRRNLWHHGTVFQSSSTKRINEKQRWET
jgi:hypothetical protein